MTIKELKEMLENKPDDAVVICHTWDGLWRELECVELETNGTVTLDTEL